MHGYPTQQAAANAGEKALRFLESEALKQEQGIMADKHFKPPETTPNPLIDGMMRRPLSAQTPQKGPRQALKFTRKASNKLFAC